MITGLETQAERADESERIINWAFRQFVERRIAPAGSRIAEADIWMGAAPRVGLTVPDDLTTAPSPLSDRPRWRQR